MYRLRTYYNNLYTVEDCLFIKDHIYSVIQFTIIILFQSHAIPDDHIYDFNHNISE